MTIQITEIESSKLIPYARNARTHSDVQISQICASIQEFGFTNPVLVDENNTIIAGHGRVIASQRMKLEKIPCIYLNNLSEAQKKAYVIADNQLALNAGWNEELLSIEVEELKNLDFNLDLLGFDDPESLIIKDVEGFTDEDEIPESLDEIKVKQGDLWILGNHRLFCGDCTSADNITSLFEEQTVDLLLTDPPYGVDYSSKNTFLNSIDKGNRIQKDIKNDNIEDITQFCTDFLSIIPFSEYNIFYIFFGGLQLHNLRKSIDDSGLKFSQYLIWNKNNHVLTRQDYLAKNEFILYGWKNRHKFYGSKKRTTVIDYDRPLVADLHPTMKPVGLLETFIEDGSLNNQNVYDPFLGSGSTLIACEKHNRKCFGFELEPSYVSTIIQRWENFTQKTAYHSETGKSFKEICDTK
tara:strand:+ start:138 stop:1367 length:1230 start_codon:yes stop_codon:yes gene_type:complete